MSISPTETIRQNAGRRLVAAEVIYCVSSLVAGLASRDWDGSEPVNVDTDDLARLSIREPGADEYREAAIYADRFDTPVKPGGDAERIDVALASDETGEFWRWSHVDSDGDAVDDGEEDSEVEAWRAAFESAGLDTPDGSEIFEHWIVSGFLADQLEEHGESIARDVAGLTIWGRATTGQAIAMDSVIQDIAIATYGVPAPALPVCAECGNDGTKAALYVTIDAQLDPRAAAWVLREREDAGGRELDCLACDHRTPAPIFPYGAMIPAPEQR